jgi:hypothetical protein
MAVPMKSSYHLDVTHCSLEHGLIFQKIVFCMLLHQGLLILSSDIRSIKPDVRGNGTSIPSGGKDFLFSTASRPALRPTQPPSQWVSRTLFLGIKRPGNEAHHLTSSSATVTNALRYTTTPPFVLIAWCLSRTGTILPFTHWGVVLWRIIRRCKSLTRAGNRRQMR